MSQMVHTFVGFIYGVMRAAGYVYRRIYGSTRVPSTITAAAGW